MTAQREANWTWIDPSLAVGGRLVEAALPSLFAAGVSHVVDLRSEQQDDPRLLHEHGLTLLALPTDDHCAVSEAMLEQGVCWVRQQREAGHKVLVHCEHGIGRSVLLAWCVLLDEGQTAADSLMRIKSARPCASPSPAQIDALLAFAARRWPETRQVSWEELADIAYAHVPGRVPARERA